MRFSRIAVIIASLLSGPGTVLASTASVGPSDRAVLADYARDTWHSIAAVADRSVLPADALRRVDNDWVVEGLTSPTNIASYVWSTVAAEDLDLISAAEADRRVRQVLTTLSLLERSHGFFYNWYDPATGERAKVWTGGRKLRPFLSVVDNGWLAAALMLIRNTRPEFRAAADALLAPMNFAFFYDPFDPSDPAAHPGLLRGGYYPDTETFAGFHYGALNTEPRIASYIGIARKELPPDHYYRMFRSRPTAPRDRDSGDYTTCNGVTVDEGTVSYRELQIVPSWDGTMFEALMVPLLVPEADWAPRSWGVNHPLYVRAQIEYGLKDAHLGYWGNSAASTPEGGYSAYGVAALGIRTQSEPSSRSRESIIAPYASFLALQFAPQEAMANLRALAHDFPVYGSYGFMDSVDVVSGRVSDRVLVLDQGMILAALSGVIGNDVLRRGFSAGPVEATVRPLIALERFDSRIDPTSVALIETVQHTPAPAASLASPGLEPSFLSVRPRRMRENLFAGLITAAGLSAVIACGAKVSRGARPPALGS
jgi:hypothetical protein